MLRTRELIRRRRERRRRPRPLLHLVPNMFTILGLCLGLTALRFGLDGRFEMAVALIIAAAVTDGLDGRSARMLKVTSKLGAELDSLADFVNFGVVPAVLVYLWVLDDVRTLGWAITILFATCCALRLARFNSELEDPNPPRWSLYFFKGVPAPAAAGLALTPMMLSFVLGGGWPATWTANALMMVVVAILMISTLPTLSVKRLRVKPEQVPPVLLVIGVVMVMLVTEPWLTLSVVGLAYLASLPFTWLAARRMQQADAAAVPPAADEVAAGAAAERPTLPAAQSQERIVGFGRRGGAS